MLQRPSPILVSDRFPALLDALLDVLGNLTSDEWALPTAAYGWSVKDVALHLLGDEVGILSGKRDGNREQHPAIDGWDELVAYINQRNEMWVQAGRRISPRLIIDLLRITGEQTSAFFRTLDPYSAGGEVSWAAAGPAPVWLEIAREFTERWHHQQHIRDAVNMPGCNEPFFLGPVLAAFVYALPRTYQEVHSADGSSVTLEITGKSGGAWTVRRESGRWELYRGKARTSAAGIILPEEAAWRLFTRGITADQARASAVLSGEMQLAEKLLDTISIIA